MREEAIKAEPGESETLPLLSALAACAPAAPVVAEEADQEPLDSRGARRMHVLLPVSIETDMGEMPAKLRNLSASGALIETGVPLEPGSSLLFKRGLMAIFATVVWADAGRAGIAFDSEIDEGNLFVLARRLPASPIRPWIGHA